MFRPILPPRLAVPPPAGRHQPHQESEGEGQGGELQRQVETQEEEPITQLRVSEAPPSAPVPGVDVGAGARDLHSPLLLGEWPVAAGSPARNAGIRLQQRGKIHLYVAITQ